MQLSVATAMALHVLATVFWAGSSFVVARMEGVDARRLFASQAGSGTVAIATGAYLWRVFHPNIIGRAEQVLAIGIGAAGLALALQVAAFLKLRAAGTTGRIATLHFPAAGLLAITAVSMAVFRFL
jgi:hypothetical protein